MIKKRGILLIGFIVLLVISFALFSKRSMNFIFPNAHLKAGDSMDVFNGVVVYYNSDVGHVEGRNRAKDGYNLGLKYQCVEFVKRYYYKHYNHKMPDPAGHAIDFFNAKYNDGELNKERGLLQFKNGSTVVPEVGDLVVMKGRGGNKYGHVAIVSEVKEKELEVIQQNSGTYGKSRETFDLEKQNGKYKIDSDRILGWLRLSKKN